MVITLLMIIFLRNLHNFNYSTHTELAFNQYYNLAHFHEKSPMVPFLTAFHNYIFIDYRDILIHIRK